MNIKGIHKTSLIDYPGKISSVLFSGGCNLRCKYCHNPELACNSCSLETFTNDEALTFLKERRRIIDGLTLSGGEPTISGNIEDFLESVRDIGLPAKLDTNGLKPEVVERLIRKGLLDYIAVDLKTSPEKYTLLTERDVDFSRIRETLDIVRESGVEYEVRTTCIPFYVTMEDFASIKREIGLVKKYYLHQFVNTVTLHASLRGISPYSLSTLNQFRAFVTTFSTVCELRGV